MTTNRKIAYIFFVTFLIYEILLFWTVGLKQPLWGDEHHFVPTIQNFGQDLSLHQLKTYNEMSTPLPFILYALWGKVFGYELYALRFFSVLIAFLVCFTYYFVFFTIFRKNTYTVLLSLFLMWQPYMIGLTVFVFTDMLPLLFMGLCLLAIRRNNAILFFAAGAAMLLCRQYYIFFTAASGFYYLYLWYIQRSRKSIMMIIGTIFSVLPLLGLFLLWEGFTPQNEIKIDYTGRMFHFHFTSLILYISLLTVYLLPIILIQWRKFYPNVKRSGISVFLSLFYMVSPIHASEPAMRLNNVYTVGFFHKFVRRIAGVKLEHYIFYLVFLLSLPVLLAIIEKTLLNIKNRYPGWSLFTGICTITFLVIMPLSYLHWEKYFLPVIPLVAIHLLIANSKSDQMEEIYISKKNSGEL